jgi:hypothetical protein
MRPAQVTLSLGRIFISRVGIRSPQASHCTERRLVRSERDDGSWGKQLLPSEGRPDHHPSIDACGAAPSMVAPFESRTELVPRNLHIFQPHALRRKEGQEIATHDGGSIGLVIRYLSPPLSPRPVAGYNNTSATLDRAPGH